MLYKWFYRTNHTTIFTTLLGIFIYLSASLIVVAKPISNVFINEIHYDNSGADQGEFIELIGSTGINLSGWSLHFYNGSNGEEYKAHTFTDWQLNDTINGFGFAGVNITGIQNGSPDGIVLADAQDNIIQFLSYEGSFTASSGLAAGLLSTDIGVIEASNTPVGFSLQLAGQGSEYQDFFWTAPQKNTFGKVNFDQSFISNTLERVSVNEPSSLFLLSFMLFVLGVRKAKISKKQ